MKVRVVARAQAREVEEGLLRGVGITDEGEQSASENIDSANTERQPKSVPFQADEGRLGRDPGQPARARHEPDPGPVDPIGDVQIPPRPDARSRPRPRCAGRRRRARLAAQCGSGRARRAARWLSSSRSASFTVTCFCACAREDIRAAEDACCCRTWGDLQKVKRDGLRRDPRPTSAESWKMRMIERVSRFEQRAPIRDLLRGRVESR